MVGVQVENLLMRGAFAYLFKHQQVILGWGSLIHDLLDSI